jgi:hypothetical protein
MTLSTSKPSAVRPIALGTAAVSAALPGVAAAQSEAISSANPSANFQITVDAGAAYSQFSDDLVSETQGKYGEPGRDSGFYGSIKASRAINNNWDWSVGATYLGFGSNNSSRSDLFFTFDFDSALSASTLDFDVGRSWQIGAGNVRIGLGLRGGQMDQKFNHSATDKFGNSVTYPSDTSFEGFGPKLEVSFDQRLKPQSPFTIFGSLGASSLSGDFTTDKGFLGGGKQSDKGQLNIGTLVLGMGYQQDESTTFRFGLRADEFTMVGMDNVGANSFYDDWVADENVSATTAFVGVDVKF